MKDVQRPAGARDPYRPSSELRQEVAATEKRLVELRLGLAYAERQESIWAEEAQ